MNYRSNFWIAKTGLPAYGGGMLFWRALRCWTIGLLAIFLLPGWNGRAEEPGWDLETLRRATIYVPPEVPRKKKDGGDLVRKAAQDLRDYVKKMTGVELPVTEIESAKGIPADQPAFVLDELARQLGARPPKTEFGEDGYVLECKGPLVLLAGEGGAGTAYAVADFLHEQGVRFYMPGPYGEVVPSRTRLVLPGKPREEVPAFEDRRLWLNGGSANRFSEVSPGVPDDFADWLRRNRGTLSGRVPTRHMWSSVFRSSGLTRQEAFEKHPDWFVVVRGQRNPRHLNLLNEEVVDLFVRHFQKQLKGVPKDEARVLSISPDDQVIVNESAEAARWMEAKDIIFTNLPDATDYLIQFNNRVIEKLNAEYPNVRLAFYVYSNYQNAPSRVVMNPHLIPFLAPLNFSRYHALTDRTKPSRTLLAHVVDRWDATGAKLGWRDYAFLCPDAMLPFNRLHMTRRDIPWLHDRGVRYLSLETISNWPNLVPELYLLTRLLWDVRVDQEAELKEFYTQFFGPAAGPMEAYVNEVSAAYDSLPFSSGNKEFVASVFTPERLAGLRGKLEEAKKLAAEDGQILHRIGLFETALRQAERFMAMREAVNRFDYETAERLNQSILQAFDEDLKFDPHTNTMFVKDAWYRRFFGDQIGKVADWVKGAEVLYVFPDEWPAHFDFTKTGEAEALPHPGTRAFELFSLKTYSRSLAEQGWEKFRGDIWYQQKFPAVQVPLGKKLFLVFGGVDRFLKVWINGTVVGEGNGARGFDPVLLPVDASILSDKGNTLTVRVNNEAPTELGVGGLIRPVALIAK